MKGQLCVSKATGNVSVPITQSCTVMGGVTFNQIIRESGCSPLSS